MVNYPFFPFVPSYLKVVEEVTSLGWERYGGQIRILEVTHFGENIFLASWASKCLEMDAQAIIHTCLSFLTHSHSRWALSCS